MILIDRIDEEIGKKEEVLNLSKLQLIQPQLSLKTPVSSML